MVKIGKSHKGVIPDAFDELHIVDVKDRKYVGMDELQYNKDEIHHNVEFDTKESSSEFHKKVIEKNDPKSQNEFIILK